MLQHRPAICGTSGFGGLHAIGGSTNISSKENGGPHASNRNCGEHLHSGSDSQHRHAAHPSVTPVPGSPPQVPGTDELHTCIWAKYFFLKTYVPKSGKDRMWGFLSYQQKEAHLNVQSARWWQNKILNKFKIDPNRQILHHIYNLTVNSHSESTENSRNRSRKGSWLQWCEPTHSCPAGAGSGRPSVCSSRGQARQTFGIGSYKQQTNREINTTEMLFSFNK